MNVQALPQRCPDCRAGKLCYKHTRERDEQVQADSAALREQLAAAKASAKLLGLVWEEPPPVWRIPYETQFGARLDVLMMRPGAWAALKSYETKTGAYNAAQELRKAGLRPGSWEFRGARTETGSKLYARFLRPDPPKAVQ